MPPRLKFSVHACSGEARALPLREIAAGDAANADARPQTPLPASKTLRRARAGR
jgi:hypothetical protein